MLVSVNLKKRDRDGGREPGRVRARQEFSFFKKNI